MNIRKFLQSFSGDKVDVFDNYVDEISVAYVNGLTLTAEGEEYFKDALDIEIENIEKDSIVLKIDERTISEITANKRLKNAKKLFYSLAGYCGDENYNKWFKVKPPIKRKYLDYLEKINKNIPTELKDMKCWCCYKTYYDAEKGKMKKFVLSPHTGRWAKADTKDTWTTYKIASEFAKDYSCTGLSIALDGSGITCIDLDGAIKNGEYSLLAKEFIEKFDTTYIEQSVSGKGLHIFFKGNVLENSTYKNRVITDKGEIEVYDDKHFISMTGKSINGIKELSTIDENTRKELQILLGKRTQIKQVIRQTNNQSDSEVIRKIEASKKGKDFKELYYGGCLTGDHSRDDFKLLNLLAFFTNCDAQQMERIFSTSALYRPEKEAYLKLSIENAIGTLYKKKDFNFNTITKTQRKTSENEND